MSAPFDSQPQPQPQSARRSHQTGSALARLGLLSLAATLLLPLNGWAAGGGIEKHPSVVHSDDAKSLVQFAAREARRYVYVRTGDLLAIKPVEASATPDLPPGDAIVIGTGTSPLIQTLAGSPLLRGAFATLEADAYRLKTVRWHGHTVLLIAGGTDTSTLYGVYQFAEHLGMRFYLHGDVAPDARLTSSAALPWIDERHAPIFDLRGIQPFHDFPEGPDWWNLQDYKAILAQLPKLRMNFFGLHTYPENAPNAEPTVWIGPPSEIGTNGEGKVKSSYPSSYQNTLRGNWGYTTRKTSAFSFGAAELFEDDAYGADVMRGLCPQPSTPEDSNRVFNDTGAMLKRAFTWARGLGIKTCVGTETPLTIPALVAQRLTAIGKNPKDPAVIQELYEGIFNRVVAAYPLDYYWFWTPEGWTWEGTKPEQIAATRTDLNAAIEAWRRVKPGFQLATCGWVLGPVQDRSMFDKFLPKEIAVSCINREVGKTPVDRAFSDVRGRGKWAIPWMEDDPGLTMPQLWVGRMRQDAADARRYGCDGLLGIHWRTRALAPNVLALARAAWDQSPWNQTLGTEEPQDRRPAIAGPRGGTPAAFPGHEIADTDQDPIYRTVRYNLGGYRLAATNGPASVRLMFCEPHYQAAGKRVFDVAIQGRTVITNLDIFATVGADKALDFRYANVNVTNGWLDIEFTPRVEFPSIAGIELKDASGKETRIDCGGPGWGNFAPDMPGVEVPTHRFAPTRDFYLDWATAEFGSEIARQAAEILESVDGKLPRPADWVDGPGGIRPDEHPWGSVAKDYAFVETFEALRSKVKGPSQKERFDYWARTFRYLRTMARVNCAWGAYNIALREVKALPDGTPRRNSARARLIPLRREIVRLANDVYQDLLATVSNQGELGTIANWDQHLMPSLLYNPADELAALLGTAVPADAMPTTGTTAASAYQGPARIILPTLPTARDYTDDLQIKVILLGFPADPKAALLYRKLGTGKYTAVPLQHVARSVYRAVVPSSELDANDDIEFYVEAMPEGATGVPLRNPVTAPRLGHTMTAMIGGGAKTATATAAPAPANRAQATTPAPR